MRSSNSYKWFYPTSSQPITGNLNVSNGIYLVCVMVCLWRSGKTTTTTTTPSGRWFSFSIICVLGVEPRLVVGKCFSLLICLASSFATFLACTYGMLSVSSEDVLGLPTSQSPSAISFCCSRVFNCSFSFFMPWAVPICTEAPECGLPA